MLGASLGCILGLFVGGALGAVAVAVLYGIQSGRIKVPPRMGVGPIQIDTSALAKPSAGPEGRAVDLAETAPLVDTGGSIAAGCLTLIGAGLVLLGFILPWFTCNIANLIQGSFSGVTQMITLTVTLLTTVLGGLSGGRSGDLAASAILALLFVVAILLLAAIPLAGLYIGFIGLRLLGSLREPRAKRSKRSRSLIAGALVGLVPVCCYITSASAIPTVKLPQLFPGLSDIGVQSTGAGLWVTLAGFVVSIAAGFVISITASLAEQMMHPPPSTVDEIETPAAGEGEDPVQ